jgi:hypothetical protein
VGDDAFDPGFDPDVDAFAAYRVAKERSEKLRVDWESLGSPATEMGGSTGKTLVEHPLLRAMRMSEQHEMRLREVVRKKFRGPDPRAVLGLPSSQRAARNGAPEPPRFVMNNSWRKVGRPGKP